MKSIVLCAVTFMLAACGTLLPPPGDPPKKYILAALSSESGGHPLPRQLIVDLPTLYPPLDSTRIALKPQEQTIDYYADAEWADRLSALIQESFIYSLQNKGMLRGVSRATEGIQADYMLKVEVRKFYMEHENPGRVPTAHVDYVAHLVKLPERHIVASHRFTQTQAVPQQAMDNIIKSLNTAHLEASKSLVSWVLGHIR